MVWHGWHDFQARTDGLGTVWHGFAAKVRRLREGFDVQEWIDALALPVVILVAVCWAAHRFGKTIRNGEVQKMELQQGVKLAEQERRLTNLRAMLGEDA